MLLPAHYMNVTAVLTPRNILFPRSTVLGMQFAPPHSSLLLIIPLQLKTDKLPIVDGIGKCLSIRAFHPAIGDSQLKCLVELIFHPDFRFPNNIER